MLRTMPVNHFLSKEVEYDDFPGYDVANAILGVTELPPLREEGESFGEYVDRMRKLRERMDQQLEEDPYVRAFREKHRKL